MDNVRNVQEQLRKAGHTITHDWTRNETGDNMLAGDKDKLADIVETGRRAQLDIQGVIDADVYVMCTDNTKAGKGMYAELGAALALHETTKKPDVYLLGKKNHMSVFYFHPAVKHLSSVEELTSLLAEHSR